MSAGRRAKVMVIDTSAVIAVRHGEPDFAYALAHETGEPRLFKGNDVTHNGLERA